MARAKEINMGQFMSANTEPLDDSLLKRLTGQDHYEYLSASRSLAAPLSDFATNQLLDIGLTGSGVIRVRMMTILKRINLQYANVLAIKLLEEPQQKFVISAIQHLIVAEYSDATEQAVNVINTHPDVNAKIEAICYLACFGDSKHLQLLTTYTSDESIGVEGRTLGGEAMAAIYNINLRS